jgi:hypothetical protein
MVDYEFTEDRTMVEARCARLVSYIVAKDQEIRLNTNERDKFWINCFYDNFKKLYTPDKSPRSITRELVALAQADPLASKVKTHIDLLKIDREKQNRMLDYVRSTVADLDLALVR